MQTDALIVGAGVSGIKTALELAEIGHKVMLIEKSPAIGGILPWLDHQFSDDHCGMCRMLPMVARDPVEQTCLKKGLQHRNISIKVLSEVKKIEGSAGNFEVSIESIPTGVDVQACINCMECEAVCPEVSKIKNPLTGNPLKSIYRSLPFNLPAAPTIDWNSCTLCGECEKVCPTNAIQLDNGPKESKVTGIKTVIGATGSPMFDPSPIDLYGYDRFEDVVTSLEYEQLLSKTGQNGGKLLKPSDGAEVKRIAWIQCVGSRNLMLGADYCSNACCMMSLKEAIATSNKTSQKIEKRILYMDMRTHGRDYQRYRDEAEKDPAIELIRCRVHSIESGENNHLSIGYLYNQEKKEGLFDLVVLAMGNSVESNIPNILKDLADQEGIIIPEGASQLRDIQDSVIAASSVAMKADIDISRSKNRGEEAIEIDGTQTDFDILPQLTAIVERSKHPQVPADFYDTLASNLRSHRSVNNLIYVETIRDKENLPDQIDELSEDHKILFVSLQPNTNWLDSASIAECLKIPKHQYDFINLSFLWNGETNAFDLDSLQRSILMSAEQLLGRTPIFRTATDINNKALVIGGGPAGMSAAISLAERGTPVSLLEKKSELGGSLNKIVDKETVTRIEALKESVKSNQQIEVYLDTEIIESSGMVGEFNTRILQNSTSLKSIDHGATIIATGGQKNVTSAFDLGTHQQIVDHNHLEEILSESPDVIESMNTIVMIQCAGSREEPDNYCSRTCCVKSVKNAINIKENNPSIKVWVFYRDMMTYGLNEKIYTEARRNGVLFIPYDVNAKPHITSKSNSIEIKASDPVTAKELTIEADLVSLAVGLKPNDNSELVRQFKLKTTIDGFLREADTKWRPVDSGREGVFVCGLARAPMSSEEAIEEGRAAALRAMRILSKKPMIKNSSVVASVRPAICSQCKLCIEVCPYEARYFHPDLDFAQVNPVSCQGCGQCASVCPNNASVINQFEDSAIMNSLETGLL